MDEYLLRSNNSYYLVRIHDGFAWLYHDNADHLIVAVGAPQNGLIQVNFKQPVDFLSNGALVGLSVCFAPPTATAEFVKVSGAQVDESAVAVTSIVKEVWKLVRRS